MGCTASRPGHHGKRSRLISDLGEYQGRHAYPGPHAHAGFEDEYSYSSSDEPFGPKMGHPGSGAGASETYSSGGEGEAAGDGFGEDEFGRRRHGGGEGKERAGSTVALTHSFHRKPTSRHARQLGLTHTFERKRGRRRSSSGGARTKVADGAADFPEEKENAVNA